MTLLWLRRKYAAISVIGVPVRKFGRLWGRRRRRRDGSYRFMNLTRLNSLGLLAFLTHLVFVFSGASSTPQFVAVGTETSSGVDWVWEFRLGYLEADHACASTRNEGTSQSENGICSILKQQPGCSIYTAESNFEVRLGLANGLSDRLLCRLLYEFISLLESWSSVKLRWRL